MILWFATFVGPVQVEIMSLVKLCMTSIATSLMKSVLLAVNNWLVILDICEHLKTLCICNVRTVSKERIRLFGM